MVVTEEPTDAAAGRSSSIEMADDRDSTRARSTRRSPPGGLTVKASPSTTRNLLLLRYIALAVVEGQGFSQCRGVLKRLHESEDQFGELVAAGRH